MPKIRYDRGGFHHFPNEAREQMAALKKNEISDVASEHLSLNESKTSLYCALSLENNLLAFVESEIQGDRAKLESIVVAGKQRRLGLGSKLMRFFFEALNDMGVKQIHLQVPSNKQPFFTRFGFVSLNDSSYEQRCQMLQPSISYFLANTPSSSDPENPETPEVMQLGKDTKQYTFTNEEQYTDLHRVMLNQARKRIWILAPNIDCPVINSEDTSQAIYRLIKRNSESEIRILLTNDKIGAGYFNPCINIAQRLSSYVEIRHTQSNGSRINESITLVDYGATIFRKHMNLFSGFASFHNRLLYERLRNNFDNHWQFARPSIQLRRLVV